MKTLIIGLGNPLLRDDAVGLRVAKVLREILNGETNVTVEEDYWGGLRLMERMIGFERAIVIDAIQSGAAPGTIHMLLPDGITTQRSASCHDVNLPTALAVGRHAGAILPRDDRILLIGIEAADVQTFDEELTSKVESAVPKAVQVVISALRDIKHADEM